MTGAEARCYRSSRRTFEALVGGHSEFATTHQRDVEEFLTHLISALRRHVHCARARGTEAERELTEMLVFGLEQRLQCTACAGVSYRVDPHDLLSVPVLARETGKDAEGRATYEAPLTRRALRDVPSHARRSRKKFRFVNWVSTKLGAWLSLAP
ncbi:hypothetical protein EDB85DRAFT_2222761 [Lactarius pseudohatsudake]|nr:hypothetical protein EDB85DRAFT_2222761 [Lactarius pseudohatsudake]